MGVSQGKYPEIAEKNPKKSKHPRPTGASPTKKKIPVQQARIYAIIIPESTIKERATMIKVLFVCHGKI